MSVVMLLNGVGELSSGIMNSHHGQDWIKRIECTNGSPKTEWIAWRLHTKQYMGPL